MHPLLDTLGKLLITLRNFWHNLLYSLANHIRSKLKTTGTPFPRRRSEVIQSILDQPGFRKRLEEHSSEHHLLPAQVEGLAKTYLWEIAADLNYLYIPFYATILNWVFNALFEGFVIDEKRLAEFREIAKGKPIIFVPNHRSHLDYMILSYLFYENRVPMPHVCAGTNLSFWPLGPLIRKGGGFFVRRSYDGNNLYAACVQAYIEEILSDKVVLEFFIEGSRSRTGKLLAPRMGILSAIVQAYLNRRVDDALLVPISLTYDHVLEENSYLQESAGNPKRPEGKLDLVRILRFLKKRTGKVYLRFGEAISLKGAIGSSSVTDKRKLVEDLAFQLTYGINKSLIVTPASLVASAVLSHPKRVITIDQVSARLDPLMNYLRFKGCRFSEPLTRYPLASIREAINLACHRGILKEYRDEEGPFFFIPEEKRPLLNYYKNGVLHFFVSIGTLATLLEKAPLGSAPMGQAPGGRLSISQMEEDFRFFQNLYRYEFLFSRRQPLREHIQKVVDYLVREQVIRNDDNVLEIRPDRKEDLRRFSVLIAPYLEGYRVVLEALPSFRSHPWEKKELIRSLLHKGHMMYLKEKIRYPEAISNFLFENALRSFKEFGLIQEQVKTIGRSQSTFFQSTNEVSDTVKEKLLWLLQQ